MGSRMTIALDAMGGDFGASVVVPAAVDFIKRDPDVDLILVGRQQVIEQHLGGEDTGQRLQVHHASEEASSIILNLVSSWAMVKGLPRKDRSSTSTFGFPLINNIGT